MHENFTDYVFAKRERESACMNRGGGCSTSGPLKAGKVSGKWANTGLLGALDARLDDSAPASDGISYAELTVVTSQLFDMRAAHMYIHRFISILQYYIYVRFQLLHVCNANRSKGASSWGGYATQAHLVCDVAYRSNWKSRIVRVW